MCQTSVLIEKDGGHDVLLEDVAALDVLENGVSVTTLFAGPKELPGVAIRRIDFSAGKVFLYQTD